jgi:N6-L-threonylcarbamoyladenine synthase
MTILAIESSCDETSAAVIENSAVLSNIISSQYFHSKFGGVVPELASRAHLKAISSVVNESLDSCGKTMADIEALAVTSEPGLIGSLIVGSNFAKALSIRYNIPVVPVNHIEGHLFSGNLQEEVPFPFISMVVSGGHTALFYVTSFTSYEIMGLTKDDAAGEAFDKTAKLLGLPYPGGPEIDKLAKSGNPKAYNFPRSMMHSGDYNFSFSGLKTSVRYFVQKEFPDGVPEEKMPDICASVQAAIVDILVHKAITAALEKKVKSIVIAGGVSANSGLRTKISEEAAKHNIKSIAPMMSYCMDNAAMIGYIASQKLKESGTEPFFDLSFKVNSNALRAKKK